MKKYITAAILVLIIAVFTTCKKEPDAPSGGNKIEIGQTEIDTVSYFEAQVSSAANTGGNEISQHGHCWSTKSKPTTDDANTTFGKLDAPKYYTSQLTDLEDNTAYYIRPYVTYPHGTVYGTEENIKTLKTGKPVVNTTEVTNVTLYSAQCSGDVLADSGLYVTTRGVCWDTTNNFTITDCLDTTVVGDGTGSFISNITGLNEGVKYFVKVYAINDKGISYGNVKQFTTVPITLPEVSTSDITDITINSATSGGNVISNGNATVNSRGVCWNTTGNPTLQNSLGHTTDGSGTGSYTSEITGLNDGVTYFVSAYATNEKGTAYGDVKQFTTINISLSEVTTTEITEITINSAKSGGNVTDNGNSAVSARGVCWNTGGNPTLENNLGHTTNGNGTGSFTSEIAGLNEGVTYFVSAFATNEKGTSYGEVKQFNTFSITLPKVTTNDIADITQTTATSGGNVTSDGGADVTIRGVCWSTNPNPTTVDDHTVDGSGTGTFISEITGLAQNTQYYVRAYATNSQGTAYGNENTFTTPEDPCNGITSFTYEGQTYSTVGIGSQCWMKENLNVGTRIDATEDMQDNQLIEKYCHDNDESNCDTYGGLYQWDEMMQYVTNEGVQGICPAGWHIPTDDEWKTLEMFLGMSQSEADGGGWRGTDEGKKLKSTSGWNSGGNGTDEVGFTAIPGGYRYTNGGFYDIDINGFWWSATEYSSTLAWSRSLYHNYDKVSRGGSSMDFGFSVRCVRD